MERETTLTCGSLSMGCQRVKTGQPINSGQGFGQQWSIAYFTLYLAGGSSIGTLKGLD